MSGGMMCRLVYWWFCVVVVAVWASAGKWSGWMLNCHILAPACSQCPWRMIAPVFLMTLTSVSVKITVHPASQNLPMLSRLLANDVMIWQSLVPGGKCGRKSSACPLDWMRLPSAIMTEVGIAVEVKLVVGAFLFK